MSKELKRLTELSKIAVMAHKYGSLESKYVMKANTVNKEKLNIRLSKPPTYDEKLKMREILNTPFDI